MTHGYETIATKHAPLHLSCDTDHYGIGLGIEGITIAPVCSLGLLI
jgi:hypothetical protein